MHVEAGIIESDADQVDTVRPKGPCKPLNPISLDCIDTIDGVACLAARSHLYHHTILPVAGNKVDLSPGHRDIATQDCHPVLG